MISLDALAQLHTCMILDTLSNIIDPACSAVLGLGHGRPNHGLVHRGTEIYLEGKEIF